MPRVIFKCPYIKGGTNRAAPHLENYVSYIATRDGVEVVNPDMAQKPATEKQQAMIQQLVREFPMSRGMFEYEDYQASPTQGNASEFITRAIEDNLDSISKRENYVDYIANRPHVQRVGQHGLFCNSDDPLVLSQIADAVAHHPGNVWLPIISLRREDAARLGYDNAENWKALLISAAPVIAEAMRIPTDQFRWYAAFHDEGAHPHIHMVCYSADGKSGFLSKKGIAEIKSELAQQIFRQDLTELYQQQTERRDALTEKSTEVMREMVQQMQSGLMDNDRIGQLMAYLAQKLNSLSGKKQYGYLKAPLKSVVNEIVDELAKDPRVAAAYDLWYQLREEVLRTYKDDPPKRLPLSQQKEFKQIKNMVIREAENIRLGTVTFEDAGMDDEPDEDTDEGENDHHRQTSSGNSTYQIPTQYRAAKAILYDGESSPEEKKSALAVLESLSDKGYLAAAHLLGKVWRDGVGIPPNQERAEHWFRLSAKEGNHYSEYALGKLLLGQKRTAEALEWLDRATVHGSQFASYRMGKLYLLGDDVPKDVEKALEYLRHSADAGNQYAQYALGKLHLLGQEVPQDKEQARAWLTAAAAQGNEYAQFLLDRIDQTRDPSVLLAATQLLQSMAQLFQDNTPRPVAPAAPHIDKKRRKRLQEKRMAMGHKIDDHADRPRQQTFY